MKAVENVPREPDFPRNLAYPLLPAFKDKKKKKNPLDIPTLRQDGVKV